MMNAEKSTSTNGAPVLWIVVAFLLLIFGGLLIAETTPLVLPPQASAESQQVDNLFKIMMAIGGAIFLLVQGAILFRSSAFVPSPTSGATASTCMATPRWNLCGRRSRR
jgi:heme/copper-type cytochrome/quinol oxidase subunit 2